MKIITVKKTISLLLLLSPFLLCNSCKKASVPSSVASTSKCKPITESTNFNATSASYQYAYSADGNLSSIKKYVGGSSQAWQDSTAILYDRVVTYTVGNTRGSYNIYAIVYEGNIFTGLPSSANVSITLDGIEQRNYWNYTFSYDTKSRLSKVSEKTASVAGDWEYDLTIIYDDKDNVTGLKYANTTGPNTVTTILASGYDDKPNPYAGIKNWPLMMHAGWSNYDPEPIFTALSKNNLLGYVFSIWTRTITYEYNYQGFPSVRTSTNKTTSGTYTFQENYNYQCE